MTNDSPNDSPGTSWRALLRAVRTETRASTGRLVFFVGCLAIGVAAVVGISASVAAIESGVRGESRSLLAADLRVTARRPLPSELDRFFEGREHQRADVRELAAMASRPADQDGAALASRLVELKICEPGYPFYGALELDPQSAGPNGAADLRADQAWIAPELAESLDLRQGDTLSIGGARFEVAALVVREPDRLQFSLSIAPRVFLSPAGFARTELDDARNRVSHRALFRLPGDPSAAQLELLEERLEDALPEAFGARVRTHTEAEPGVRRSLSRVEDYLGLVALLSLLLGGIGVAQVVRAWLAGRAQSVAVLRSLGLRAREIAAVYLGHVALLALIGSVLGAVIGVSTPFLLRVFAPELFQGASADLLQPVPFLRGIALGLGVALVFGLPPLTAVWRVPPAAVLRSEAVPLSAPPSVRYGAPLVLAVGVLLAARVQGGRWLHAAAFAGGLLVLVGVLALGARAVAWLTGRIPRGRFGPYLEHGLAALARPASGSLGAIVALGLGVLVIVSMVFVDRRMTGALRDALPTDAPSVFLADIQPDQWDDVRATLERHGASRIDSVPVSMARFSAIDGEPIEELVDERGRRRWSLTREQRLTWLEALPAGNEIVAGDAQEWWSAPDVLEVSLEEGYAEGLGVTLGSTLTFDVQGVPLECRVTSLRKVDWQSFRINFFLVVEPGALDGAPHARIAAARLAAAEEENALQNELAGTHPTVTLIRIRPILETFTGVLTRVALGVRALGVFTVLTGLVILAGAAAAGALTRAREAALLKALGVTRAGIARLFGVEFALAGLVAGSIGALGAAALAHAFLTHVLRLEPELPLGLVPAAALVSALLATAAGLAASRRALLARPIDTLRAS